MALRHGRFYHLPLSDSQVLFFKILSYILAFISVAAALYFSMRRAGSGLCRQPQYVDAFRIGAGIYIGCFLLMNTVDYRLVFLVFAIPQLVVWMRDCDKGDSLVPRITFSAIMFSLWSNVVMRFLGRKITFAMEEFSNWIILVGLLYLFFSSLPEWFKNDLRRLFCFKKCYPSAN